MRLVSGCPEDCFVEFELGHLSCRGALRSWHRHHLGTEASQCPQWDQGLTAAWPGLLELVQWSSLWLSPPWLHFFPSESSVGSFDSCLRAAYQTQTSSSDLLSMGPWLTQASTWDKDRMISNMEIKVIEDLALQEVRKHCY